MRKKEEEEGEISYQIPWITTSSSSRRRARGYELIKVTIPSCAVIIIRKRKNTAGWCVTPGKSHQGERGEAPSKLVEVEREREKGLRKSPAAVDDDPFSALARRFRFYPGNLSLSLSLQLYIYTRTRFHTTNTTAFLPFLFLLSPRPIISRRLAGSCRDAELDNSYVVKVKRISREGGKERDIGGCGVTRK